MDSRFIGFKIPPDLADALTAAAERSERTISAEVRFALRRHLNESASPTKADASKGRAMKEPAGVKA